MKPKINYREETIVVNNTKELGDAMKHGYGTIIVNNELNDLMKKSIKDTQGAINGMNNILSATTLLAVLNPWFLLIPIVGKLIEGHAKNYNVVEENEVIKFVYTNKF